MSEWISNLKPGDSVFVCGYGLLERLERVERVTGLFVFVGGQRFAKSTGKASGTSGWHSARLYEATAERLSKHALKSMRAAIARINWQNVPDDTIEAVHKITRARAGTGTGASRP